MCSFLQNVKMCNFVSPLSRYVPLMFSTSLRWLFNDAFSTKHIQSVVGRLMNRNDRGLLQALSWHEPQGSEKTTERSQLGQNCTG